MDELPIQMPDFLKNGNKKPLPPQTPDWEKWKHMKRAKIWDAIALSMNINPDYLYEMRFDTELAGRELMPICGREKPFGSILEMFQSPYLFKGFYPFTLKKDQVNEFQRIYEISVSRLDEIVDDNVTPMTISQNVELSKFRVVAGSIGVQVPSSFPYSAQLNPVILEIEKTGEEIEIPYITDKLKTMFSIMEKYLEVRGTKNLINVIKDEISIGDRDGRMLAGILNPSPYSKKEDWEHKKT